MFELERGKLYNIYTDGSSRGNPGPGGFATVVMNENNTIMESAGATHQYDNVTNNQMELTAIKCALEIAAANPDNNFKIYSDSAYCVNICNNWIQGWRNNGWTRSKGQPIENLDMIKEIYNLLQVDFPNFIIEKIPGHAGFVGNELADAIAADNQAKLKKIFLEKHIEHRIFGFLEN